MYLGNSGCALPMSNQDWQFQNPILSVSVSDKPKYERPYPKPVKGKPVPINGTHISEFLLVWSQKNVGLEDFKRVVEEYRKAAERAQQAKQIAQAIHKLLDEEAGEVLGDLFEKVSA